MKKSLLFSSAGKWIAGLNTHGTALALTHYTTADIQADLGATQTAELAFQSARSATLAASNHVQVTRASALEFAETARTVLKAFLGERWSTAWTQAGFVRRTLQLPSNTPDTLSLVRALQTHFTNQPTHAKANAGVTAVTAGTHATALEGAEKALNTAKCAQRAKRETRDTAETTLIENLRASRSEVEAVLKPEDVRWLDFRDSVPADVRAPEAVTEIDANPGLPGHVSVHWVESLRAGRYAIEAAVGAETEFTSVATVHDTVADLEFTPGVTVRLRVRARNRAGESGPSPVVAVQVPAKAAA